MSSPIVAGAGAATGALPSTTSTSSGPDRSRLGGAGRVTETYQCQSRVQPRQVSLNQLAHHRLRRVPFPRCHRDGPSCPQHGRQDSHSRTNQPGSWHPGQVPIGFDPDQFDLPNRLANLDDDGFLGLTREEISIVEVAPNPAAPIIFDVSALITLWIGALFAEEPTGRAGVEVVADDALL